MTGLSLFYGTVSGAYPGHTPARLGTRHGSRLAHEARLAWLWWRIERASFDLPSFETTALDPTSVKLRSFVLTSFEPAPEVGALLDFCLVPRTALKIRRHFGIKKRNHLRKEYLIPLVEQGWLHTVAPASKGRRARYTSTLRARAATGCVGALDSGGGR